MFKTLYIVKGMFVHRVLNAFFIFPKHDVTSFNDLTDRVLDGSSQIIQEVSNYEETKK